jgi:hypothetical protein
MRVKKRMLRDLPLKYQIIGVARAVPRLRRWSESRIRYSPGPISTTPPPRLPT